MVTFKVISMYVAIIRLLKMNPKITAISWDINISHTVMNTIMNIVKEFHSVSFLSGIQNNINPNNIFKMKQVVYIRVLYFNAKSPISQI